jgi:hypothetical protein
MFWFYPIKSIRALLSKYLLPVATIGTADGNATASLRDGAGTHRELPSAAMFSSPRAASRFPSAKTN